MNIPLEEVKHKDAPHVNEVHVKPVKNPKYSLIIRVRAPGITYRRLISASTDYSERSGSAMTAGKANTDRNLLDGSCEGI